MRQGAHDTLNRLPEQTLLPIPVLLTGDIRAADKMLSLSQLG